ncbi:MAG: PEGA domain-containing protein [Myxococcota bacterium]
MPLTPLLLWLLAGAPAFAQDNTDTAVDLAQEADLHFQLGIEAYKDKDYTRALEHMLLSNRLAPNKNVTFNVAQCYVGLRQYNDAYRAFNAYITLESDPERQAVAQREMNKFADRVALLNITSDPPGATIYVDRKNLGSRGTTPAVLALPPGEHTVILERQGHDPSNVQASLTSGTTTDATATLEARLASVRVVGTVGARAVIEETGEFVGALPMDAKMLPGPKVLVISKPGFEDERILISPALDDPKDVNVELNPLTSPVEIATSKRGARVEVDGELVGYTPVLADLALGDHEVVVSLDGFQSVVTSLDVKQDDRASLDLALIPIQEVVTGSGVSEDLLDAPASITVIDSDEIERRGYDDLAELVRDLPGFDNMLVNGTNYQVSYQRGYRTPFTQRTLFLVDGRVDNHLWTHMANLSRQYPMTMIDRVEVLYGPASAVYGANAFLGIINVVTKKGSSLGEDGTQLNAKVGYGSFRTKVIDGTVLAQAGEVSFNASGRIFVSDEDDLSGKWGFVDNDQLTDPSIWGGMLDVESYGQTYGEGYADPTRNWGAQGNVQFRGFEIGALMWDRTEGYGPYYASDAGHSAATWTYTSRQLYASHQGELAPGVTITSRAGWRDNRVLGDWAESFFTDGSRSVSLTHWHSHSNAWNADSTLNWTAHDNVNVQVGGRYEHKVLTKSYDIPGYGFSSTPIGDQQVFFDPSDVEGRDAFQAGPEPSTRMSRQNLQPTDDVGAFVQATWNLDNFRLSAGARVDRNSFYHRSILGEGDPNKDILAFNPRASAIYKLGDTGAIKLLYGEAFQEPPPIQVWGGWNGRAANENLVPEKARSVELVAMVRSARFVGEVSGFAGFYNNVIKEEAENAGTRRTLGGEARLTTTLPNPVPDSDDIEGYANYTFTQTTSSSRYDHGAGAWLDQSTNLGDIAPHKVNLGVSVPLGEYFLVHTRGNFVSSRTPYTRNPLRASAFSFDPYVSWNAYVEGGPQNVKFGLRIWNILDTDYLMPGAEGASAGDDFDQPSLGFQNSAVPSAGRSFLGTLRVKI